MRPTIHIGRGSVAVENPPQSLLDNLKRFRRHNNGGSYEPLYVKAEESNMIVTAPGFARRVINLCEGTHGFIKNEKVPMPDTILSGSGFWGPYISDAITNEGGVIAIPELLGAEEVCASIIRAFPHEALVDRGTPLCVIAEKDLESARRIVKLLRAMLPDREVSCPSLGGIGNDGDDIIVTLYNSLDEIPLRMAGVFIGLDLHGDFIKRAEKISMLRNAARWGIYETSFGGRPDELDMDVEAMFGPVVSSVTYDDAVKAGIAAPITVCWLPCPRPKTYIGGNPKVLAAFSMQENEKFVEMVSNIILNTSGRLGCICRVETLAAADRIGFGAGGQMECVTRITRKVPIKNRQRDIEAVESGALGKAIIVEDVFPRKTSHSVMVVVTCGGAEAAKRHIPWIPLKKKGDRAYIIDFTHDWDLHNGRKGRLALNDEARKKCYKDMGFNQISLEHFSQLPFM